MRKKKKYIRKYLKNKKDNFLEFYPNSIFFNNDFYEKSCKNKNKYENEWQAKFAADEQYQFNHIRLNWYKCKFCGFYHLTSNN